MTHASQPGFIDPRGYRFGGYLTGTLALAAAIVANAWLTLGLALLLLAAAVGGSRWNVWGHLYRLALRPYLGKPAYLEPEAPPRFAQLLGSLFLGGGFAFLVAGSTLGGQILVGAVSGLAYLNAAANFCVGCKIYGLLLRVRAIGARG